VTHGNQGIPSTGAIRSKDFDFLPRVFSQSLILIFANGDLAQGGGEPQYAISADSFRFC
jgi:NTF2-related export protein 1/2